MKVKIARDQDLVTSNTHEGVEYPGWRSPRQEEFAFGVDIRRDLLYTRGEVRLRKRCG